MPTIGINWIESRRVGTGSALPLPLAGEGGVGVPDENSVCVARAPTRRACARRPKSELRSSRPRKRERCTEPGAPSNSPAKAVTAAFAHAYAHTPGALDLVGALPLLGPSNSADDNDTRIASGAN
jgi:hypothetical protein